MRRSYQNHALSSSTTPLSLANGLPPEWVREAKQRGSRTGCGRSSMLPKRAGAFESRVVLGVPPSVVAAHCFNTSDSADSLLLSVARLLKEPQAQRPPDGWITVSDLCLLAHWPLARRALPLGLGHSRVVPNGSAKYGK